VTKELAERLFGTANPAGHLNYAMLMHAVNRVDNHFFDPETMRAFSSRLLGEPKWIHHPFQPGEPVVAFVTSEADRRSYTGAKAWGGERRYSIRYFDGRRVSCIGGYGAYRSRASALSAYRAIPAL
jgi:hypothetical protein